MLITSRLGNYQLPKGAKPILAAPWDTVIVAIGALIFFYWGVNSALKKPEFDDDDESDAELKAAEV